MEWREEDGVRWLEAELPGAMAAFSTRLGGVSDGDFESLNLGLLTDDERDSVLENRRRLAGALERDPESVVIGRQVHKTLLATHDRPQEPAPFAEPQDEVAEVDGHVIAPNSQIAGLVFVADCLPVVLAGSDGVAVLHCGWRGLAGGIIGEGAQRVKATAAAVGPGIGPCCYEVGDEVIEAFENLEEVADGRMLDLRSIARQLLERANVEEVEVADLCTSCEEELFFSHRRDDGRTGRQAGLGWPTTPATV